MRVRGIPFFPVTVLEHLLKLGEGMWNLDYTRWGYAKTRVWEYDTSKLTSRKWGVWTRIPIVNINKILILRQRQIIIIITEILKYVLWVHEDYDY